jgi:hypothetical protein
MKKLSYDFEITSFVGIEAPEGTSLDTLIEEANREFIDRFRNGEVELNHFQTYDPETGEYELVKGPSPLNALAKEQGIKNEQSTM